MSEYLNETTTDETVTTVNLPETEQPTIYAKMLSARIEFHETELVKTGVNEFTAGRYFKLEDFLPHAMKCCGNQGLLPVVSFTTEYATMTVFDVETNEAFVITSPMSTAQLKACHPVQNLGAVESYERRYLWLALMECMEGEAVEEQKPAAELATPEQIAAMFDYAETDLMTDGQKTWLDKASDKITESQAAYVLEKLHEKEAEQDDELYDLTGQYLALAELADDPNMPEDALTDSLEGIEGEIELKAEALLQVVAGLEGDTGAIDAEIKRLQARKAVINNRAQSLKDYLKTNMQQTGINKIACPLFQITLAKPRPIVAVVDERVIPDKYIKTTTVKAPMKKEILAALKAGETVPGCELGESSRALLVK